jgi:hypothetical protein
MRLQAVMHSGREGVPLRPRTAGHRSVEEKVFWRCSPDGKFGLSERPLIEASVFAATQTAPTALARRDPSGRRVHEIPSDLALQAAYNG